MKRKVSSAAYRTIVEQLPLAVFVLRGGRMLDCNTAARTLLDRLRTRYNIELLVILQDHLSRLYDGPTVAPVATLITTPSGEPFYVNVMPLAKDEVAVTVRELGAEMQAFRRRYRLSLREMQVAELVLHGYRNREIAGTLGIRETTTKRHLMNIFDKVGVDSRTQLAKRLA